VVGAATDRSWVAFCLSADSLQVKILALTVITSMSDQDLEEVGVASTVREQVARLARLAIAAGCHGVVSSPLEARQLREVLPPGALIVTPGTQLSGDAQSDHARAATPAQAIAAGATRGHRSPNIACLESRCRVRRSARRVGGGHPAALKQAVSSGLDWQRDIAMGLMIFNRR